MGHLAKLTLISGLGFLLSIGALAYTCNLEIKKSKAWSLENDEKLKQNAEKLCKCNDGVSYFNNVIIVCNNGKEFKEITYYTNVSEKKCANE